MWYTVIRVGQRSSLLMNIMTEWMFHVLHPRWSSIGCQDFPGVSKGQPYGNAGLAKPRI